MILGMGLLFYYFLIKLDDDDDDDGYLRLFGTLCITICLDKLHTFSSAR